MKIGIAGCGRAGTALARALAARHGAVRLGGLLSRSPRKAAALRRSVGAGEVFRSNREILEACDAILLCVPDGVVEERSRALARVLPGRRPAILHLSGALGAEVLRAVRGAGAPAGSLHPLTSFPPRASGRALPAGIWFALGGDRRAVLAGRRIVSHLRGRILPVPDEARAPYHLAATMVANHSAVIAALALEILARRGGIGGARVRRAFASLLRSVADGIEIAGPGRALTGPAARGDLGTLRRHLGILGGEPAEVGGLYRLLSALAADVSEERGGLDPAAADAVRRLLEARRTRGR